MIINDKIYLWKIEGRWWTWWTCVNYLRDGRMKRWLRVQRAGIVRVTAVQNLGPVLSKFPPSCARVVSMWFMLFPPLESAFPLRLRHCYADSKLQPVAEGDEEVPWQKFFAGVRVLKLGTTCWKWKELEFYIVLQWNAMGNPVKNSMKYQNVTHVKRFVFGRVRIPMSHGGKKKKIYIYIYEYKNDASAASHLGAEVQKYIEKLNFGARSALGTIQCVECRLDCPLRDPGVLHPASVDVGSVGPNIYTGSQVDGTTSQKVAICTGPW